MIELGPSRKRLSGGTEDTVKYHRIARKLLGILMERMQRHGIRALSHRVTLADGTVIKVRSSFGQQTYEIRVPDTEPLVVPITNGIVCIPASDEVPNGWGFPYEDDQGVEINPPLGTEGGTYPKVYYANGGITRSSTWYETFQDDLHVGNIDWRNAGKDIILSFDGNNRYWGADTPYISDKIYYNGKVLCRVLDDFYPQRKVLGVAVNASTGDLIYAEMYGTTEYEYVSFRRRPFREDGDYPNDNVYDAVDNPLGWRYIGGISDGTVFRKGSMALFNASGTECVIALPRYTKIYTIKVHESSIDVEILDQSNFSNLQTIETTHVDNGYEKSTTAPPANDVTCRCGHPEDVGNEVTGSFFWDGDGVKNTGYERTKITTQVDRFILAVDYVGDAQRYLSWDTEIAEYIDKVENTEIYTFTAEHQYSAYCSTIDAPGDCIPGVSGPTILYTNNYFYDQRWTVDYTYTHKHVVTLDFDGEKIPLLYKEQNETGSGSRRVDTTDGTTQTNSGSGTKTEIWAVSLESLDIRKHYLHYTAAWETSTSERVSVYQGANTNDDSYYWDIKEVINTDEYTYRTDRADPDTPYETHLSSLGTFGTTSEGMDITWDNGYKDFTYAPVSRNVDRGLDSGVEIGFKGSQHVISAHHVHEPERYTNEYSEADIDALSQTYTTNKRYTIQGVF